MAILTKTFHLQAFLFEPFYNFFKKSFIFFVKIAFEVDKKVFGYPYNNDLVIIIAKVI